MSNDSNGISNMPDGAYDWCVMLVASYNENFLLQLLAPHMRTSSGATFVRVRYNGSWGQWLAL